MWLEAPVEETDEQGRTTRTTRNKDEGRGTPQGGVASPLLANLYMRRFVLGWKVCGHEQRLDAHIVNYADDFVICCKPGKADEAMTAMRRMMEKLRLTVNEKKTRQCSVPDGDVYFLGVHVWTASVLENGAAVCSAGPGQEKGPGICDKIHEETSCSTTWRDTGEQVRRLNQILVGWGNYFRLGYVTGAWKVVQQHTCRRLRWWLRRKHGQKGGVQGYPDMQLYEKYGLVNMTDAIRAPPAVGVKREGLGRRAGCGRSASPVRRAGSGNGESGHAGKTPEYWDS